MKHKLRSILGSLISIAALGWVFSRVDFHGVGEAFRQVRWGWIPLLVFAYLTGFAIRGIRWRLMLRPIKRISWFSSTSVVVIGYMANNVLPARLGEFARAYVLSERENVSKASALASIFVERVFDGLALVLILGVATSASTFRPEYVTTICTVGYLAFIVFVTALIAVLLARLRRSWLESLVKMAVRFFPSGIGQRVLIISQSMLESVSFLRVDRTLPTFLLLSILVWLVEGSMFWLGLVACGIGFDPRVAYFTLAFVNFGLLMPSAPAYVGVFQAGTIVAFAAFGLPEEVALSYSILIHVLQFLPITLLGLLLVNRYGLSLQPLGKTQASGEVQAGQTDGGATGG